MPMLAPALIPVWLLDKLPWLLDAAMLMWQGEQHQDMKELRRLIEGAQGQGVAPADPCEGPPTVGSGEWVDMMETLETEAAAWDEGERSRHHHCDCEDCHGNHY
jgi:hypothetical protein